MVVVSFRKQVIQGVFWLNQLSFPPKYAKLVRQIYVRLVKACVDVQKWEAAITMKSTQNCLPIIHTILVGSWLKGLFIGWMISTYVYCINSSPLSVSSENGPHILHHCRSQYKLYVHWNLHYFQQIRRDLPLCSGSESNQQPPVNAEFW